MNDRKNLGQFFTPSKLADFMVSWTVDENTRNFLDPAVGMGIFLDFAKNKNENLEIKAYDVDPSMIKKVCNYNHDKNFDVTLGDYLYEDLTTKFDAIVCNPPYNKFQHINKRNALIDLFKNKYGIRLSGYSNYCMYFLVKSLNELSDNGRCAYIIPYEFLNAGYGKKIKDYFLATRKVKSIIKINNSLKVFPDAITTSCILLIENKIHNFIDFINVDDCENLVIDNLYDNKYIRKNYDDLDSSEKWINYFIDSDKIVKKYKNLVKFSDVAQVKRGIATGNNSYFVLSESQKCKFNLSDSACVPCIAKSPDIKEVVLDNSVYDSLLKQNKKVYLFDGEKAVSASDHDYIRYGEQMNFDKTYLTSHRTPWYAIEKKDIAPIFISVFSRGNLKVVRNKKLAKNLTTFHGIFCNNEYSDYVDILFCYLLTPIAQKILKYNKREYGEGLDKFEPNDFNRANILDLKLISVEDRLNIMNIYANINKIPNYVEKLNAIFSHYLLA